MSVTETVDTGQFDLDMDVGEETLPARVKQDMVARQKQAIIALGEELEYRKSLVLQILPAALAALKPADFVVFGDRAYLQDVGAQRVKPLIGLWWPEGKPTRTRLELGDGQFAYIIEGHAASRQLGFSDYFVGGRSSTEEFFDRYVGEGESRRRLPVDVTRVLKASYANFDNRVVSSFLGLKGLTVQELQERYKFSLEGASGITFGAGSKGGKAGASQRSPDSNYGPQQDRNKPWTEVSADGLRFWKKSCQDDLKNPEKAQWERQTKSRLEAIENEIHRRQMVAAATPAEEGGKK